jgi:hypothetical protein
LPEPEQPLNTERRAWVRYSCKRAVRAHADLAATVIFRKGTLCNVSRQGVSLLLGSPAVPGTVFKIGVEGWDGLHTLQARVIHVTPQGDGWLHGCHLTHTLSEAEVEALVS